MKPITFFLADDDPDDVDLFADVLRDVDPAITLHTAGDGEETLAKLRSESEALPDLIFLDLNMPRMGGKECLRELKGDPQLQPVPVIMYTTSSQSRDIEEAMQNGAVCFITKPSSLKELRHILSSIAGSLPNNLEKTLRQLSNTAGTFIVC